MIFGKRAVAPAQTDIEDFTGTRQQTSRQIAGLDKPNVLPPEAPTPYQQTSDNPLEVGGPLPPSIGRCADLYSDVRALRLAMEKEVDAVKARESQIREHIINNLSKSAKEGDSGASGLRFRAQIVTKEVPRAADWSRIHAYIAANNRFDLLQKRLGEKAVMDMIADKQTIPGIEVVIVPDVSITKIGR